MRRVLNSVSGVVITKWVRLEKPAGPKGWIIGFVAVSWHGLIVEGFQVLNGERGLFLDFPKRPRGDGRWLPVVHFTTAAEREDFRSAVLDALMREYPKDFEGFSAETPCGLSEAASPNSTT